MIEYLHLAGATVCSAMMRIVGAFYNRKTQGKSNTNAVYSMALSFVAFVCWGVLWLTDFSFDARVLPYSLGFAVFYGAAIWGKVAAFKTGSPLITSFLCQLSLIAVSIWGFFFWNEPFTPLVAIGFCLVVCSIFLCLYSGKTDKNAEKTKFSWKWLLFVAMSFFGNAACTIVQREQQKSFDYAHGNMLMFFALLCVTVAFFALWLKTDKKDTGVILKTNGYLPAVTGVANVLLNVFVILLANASLSASLVFPTMSVGALALTTLFSVLALKERLRWWQWLGIALGAVASITLSV